MSLGEQISDLLMDWFDTLADADKAIADSQGYRVQDWIDRSVTQVTASGGLSALVPGLHITAMAADIIFVMNRIAYTSWGIGAIMGQEIAPKVNMRGVLNCWLDYPVDYGSISAEMYESILSKSPDLQALPKEAQFMAVHDVISDVESELASGGMVDAAMFSSSVNRSISKSQAVIVKLGARAAAKAGVKIAARATARGVVGFVPLVGALANAGVNSWTMHGIANAAKKYYRNECERY